MCLRHALPAVFVDDLALRAVLRHPPSGVKGMAAFELTLELTNKTAESQTIIARALGNPAIAVETETQVALAVAAGSSGIVAWVVRGMQGGVQLLPLVSVECPALQASFRSMDRHVLVEPRAASHSGAKNLLAREESM